MSKYIPTKRRQHILGMSQFPNEILVIYHRKNILNIKEALGSRCTTLTHVEYPKYELKPVLNKEGIAKEGMFQRVQVDSQYGVYAKFRGSNTPILAMLKGTPNDIKAEYYAQLKNDLTNAARKRRLL